MVSQQFLVKQLRKKVPGEELKSLFQTIIARLPAAFVIHGQEVRKEDLSIIHLADKDIICILAQRHTADSRFQFVLLGQDLNESGYSLISQLDDNEYQNLVMHSIKDHRPTYEDLASYNLLPLSLLTQQPIVESSYINTSPQESSGFLFFQHHLDAFSWQYVINHIKGLEVGEVDFFYLELPQLILKPLFQFFNKNGNDALLRKHLKATELAFPELNELFIQLCIGCYQKNIELIPVDSTVALDKIENVTDADMISMRNNYMVNQIRANQAQHPHTKFLGLFGLAHSAMVPELAVQSVIIRPTTASPIVSGSNVRQIPAEICLQSKTWESFHSKVIQYQPEKKSVSNLRLWGSLGFFALTSTVVAAAFLASTTLYPDDSTDFRR